MSHGGDRIGIDELCALVDMPRRTVRYYIQERLVDRPAGAKRGAYYTKRHVEQLMTIRTWQRAGLSLDRIRELVSGGGETSSPLPPPRARRPGDVTLRTHVTARPRRRAGDRSAGGRPRRRGRAGDRPSSGITGRADTRGGCQEMRTSKAATLESAQGQVVLEEVAIDAAVDDLMTVLDVRQRYRNPGTRHIEAVYTFPLPVEAVLLKFTVAIGDRKLAGTVVAKTEAERRYEDAITDGDAAVLLEQPQPGLYTASVGNLAPGETATVRFRYGLLLCWNGDLVRLAVPTTTAPRYGDPSTGGLYPHQQPEYGFDAERSFRMRVSINGVLQGARWTSPSHDIAVTPDGGRTEIEIARPAAMDRDCVLEARATVASARSGAARPRRRSLGGPGEFPPRDSRPGRARRPPLREDRRGLLRLDERRLDRAGTGGR